MNIGNNFPELNFHETNSGNLATWLTVVQMRGSEKRIKRKVNLIFLAIFLMFSQYGCGPKKEALTGTDLLFKYEITALDLERGASSVALTLKNNGSSDLGQEGWDLYFNQLSGNPDSKAIGAGLELVRVQGDFWKISPTSEFKGIESGGSILIQWDIQGVMTSANFLPFTPFIKFADKEEAEIVMADIAPINPALIPESIRFTAADRWEENAEVKAVDLSQSAGVLPTPVNFKRNSGELTLSAFAVCADDIFNAEVDWLKEFLQTELSASLTTGADCNLSIKQDKSIKGDEAYTLSITEDGIVISASSRPGAFYGLQTLLSMLPPEQFNGAASEIVLPFAEIQDAPAFAYRGLHLDISRNFLPVEAVKKTLKLLAFYKVNKFHLHLTDDEGWRLEIPEIPELVSVGSRRGFTEKEEGFIHPAFGSGPDPDADSNYGSGFYSQDDLVEILELAAQHHIEVIPEIDLPGHARAAIIALEHHYKRTGSDQYRLLDPKDESEYLSIQNFPDNVINVCQESTYDFIELVVDNLIAIYSRAGLELPILHIGGDEVPKGVWTASPNCAELLASSDDWSEVSQLQQYFFYRANELLKTKGVRMGGWQEIVEKEHEGGYEDKSMIPYIWYKADEGYRLANEGYEVVLCNAGNLYFDLSYDRDPRENGLHWAGYVNTKKAFEFMPYNFQLPFDENARSDETRTILTKKGRNNIYGLQAQLWSETVFNGEMLEYYILPKLLGFAERAWKGEPGWKIDQGKKIGFEEDWSQFATQVGQQELPRLDHLYGGWNYRIPVPGISVENGMVEANISFPGFEIRYSTDGTAPTSASNLYIEPIAAAENMVFRAFSTSGRGGKTSRAE